MKTLVLFTFIFLISVSLFSQVGINTTSPSSAAALDVNSSADGTTGFGGLMPPKVTITQRDLIPVTPADDGLLVYVTDGANRFLQIYDGVDGVWRTIYPATLELSNVLAGWNVTPLPGGTGNYGPSPFAATTSSPSVVVGGLTRGTGVGTTGSGAANAWGGNGFDSGSQVNAITANDFATFTITPSFGVNVSITTIENYNIRRSGTGPILGIWQYSLDGTNFVDIESEISWGDELGATGNSKPAIDLSGISELQNLTSATTVTFRIVNWGGTAAGGTWYINQVGAGNDLIIRGNVTN